MYRHIAEEKDEDEGVTAYTYSSIQNWHHWKELTIIGWDLIWIDRTNQP